MRLKVDKFPEGRVVKRGQITVNDLRKKFQLPPDAEITLRVPTGGDYSGVTIRFGEDFDTLDVKTEEIE